MAADKQTVQNSVTTAIDKLLPAAEGALKDSYEFIKANADKIDVNKDGKGDVTQLVELAKKAGGTVAEGASSAFKNIMQAGGNIAEEGFKEGGTLDKNKFSMGGVLMGLLAAMLIPDLGIMGMIAMLLIGAAVGGMMDGEGGMLGGLFNNMFGGEKKTDTTTPGKSTESPAAGKDQSKEKDTGAYIAVDKDGNHIKDALDANGKLTEAGKNAALIAQGHFEGEGKDRKFIIDTVASMESIDGAAPKLTMNKDGVVLFAPVKDELKGKLSLPVEDGKIISTDELKKTAALVTEIKTPPAQTEPQANAAKPAPSPTITQMGPPADATPAALGPVIPAATLVAASAAMTMTATEPVPQGKDSVELIDKAGNKIPLSGQFTLYLDQNGKGVDIADSVVAIRGTVDAGGQFVTDSYAAKRENGQYPREKGGAIAFKAIGEKPDSPTPVMNIANNALDLTNDPVNKAVIDTLGPQAIAYQKGVDKALSDEAAKKDRDAESKRLAMLAINPEVKILGQTNGNVTFSFHGVSDGQEFRAVYSGKVTNVNRDPNGIPGFDRHDLTVRSGSLINEKGEELGKIAIKPFVIKGLTMNNEGLQLTVPATSYMGSQNLAAAPIYSAIKSGEIALNGATTANGVKVADGTTVNPNAPAASLPEQSTGRGPGS